MAMKIASRKKKIPSIAKPTPKASPKRPVNRGHSRPNSKERTVPVTAPTAKRTATAFDQLRASRSASWSFFRWPCHSAISITAGKATPKQARTMWNPSVKPIWLRAASRLEEVSASTGVRLSIGAPQHKHGPRRRACCSVGSAPRLEHYQRDNAVGSLLVVPVAAVEIDDLIPEPIPLPALGEAGVHSAAPRADLDRRVRVRHQG